MSISRPGVVLAIALSVLAGDATVPDVRPAELLPRDWLSVHILGPDGRPVRNAELRLFFCTPDGVPFGRSEDLFEAEVAAADPATSAAPSETRPTTMPTTRPRRGRFQSLEPHELDESLRATTDDDGDVGISLGRLRPIPPGTRLGARVELGGRWHFGYGSDTAPEDVFHWIAGTLRLAPEPAALSGVVVDERGLPASVTEFYAVFARSPAELARFSITERPFRVEADGHFRIQPEPAWPPPGTEATVIYGLAWEAPRFLRVVLGSSGVRLVIPRNAATLSGRIELAGLDPAELFVCVEQERTPGISGHWFHDYLVERRGKTRRILGKIEQDGSFRIEQAPTGVVSFIVGAGRPDRMGERNPIPAEAELIRLDGVRLSADEPCRDPRLETLDLSSRFVSARIRVRHGQDLPAVGVEAQLNWPDGPWFKSESGVLRLVAARFPLNVRLFDGDPAEKGLFHHPHFGSAVVAISGDGDVRLPTYISLRVEVIMDSEFLSKAGIRPVFEHADDRNDVASDWFDWSPEHFFDGPQEVGIRWLSWSRDRELRNRLNVALRALPAQRCLVTEELNGATMRLAPSPRVHWAIWAASLR